MFQQVSYHLSISWFITVQQALFLLHCKDKAGCGVIPLLLFLVLVMWLIWSWPLTSGINTFISLLFYCCLCFFSFSFALALCLSSPSSFCHPFCPTHILSTTVLLSERSANSLLSQLDNQVFIHLVTSLYKGMLHWFLSLNNKSLLSFLPYVLFSIVFRETFV